RAATTVNLPSGTSRNAKGGARYEAAFHTWPGSPSWRARRGARIAAFSGRIAWQERPDRVHGEGPSGLLAGLGRELGPFGREGAHPRSLRQWVGRVVAGRQAGRVRQEPD